MDTARKACSRSTLRSGSTSASAPNTCGRARRPLGRARAPAAVRGRARRAAHLAGARQAAHVGDLVDERGGDDDVVPPARLVGPCARGGRARISPAPGRRPEPAPSRRAAQGNRLGLFERCPGHEGRLAAEPHRCTLRAHPRLWACAGTPGRPRPGGPQLLRAPPLPQRPAGWQGRGRGALGSAGAPCGSAALSWARRARSSPRAPARKPVTHSTSDSGAPSSGTPPPARPIMCAPCAPARRRALGPAAQRTWGGPVGRAGSRRVKDAQRAGSGGRVEGEHAGAHVAAQLAHVRVAVQEGGHAGHGRAVRQAREAPQQLVQRELAHAPAPRRARTRERLGGAASRVEGGRARSAAAPQRVVVVHGPGQQRGEEGAEQRVARGRRVQQQLQADQRERRHALGPRPRRVQARQQEAGRQARPPQQQRQAHGLLELAHAGRLVHLRARGRSAGLIKRTRSVILAVDVASAGARARRRARARAPAARLQAGPHGVQGGADVGVGREAGQHGQRLECAHALALPPAGGQVAPRALRRHAQRLRAHARPQRLARRACPVRAALGAATSASQL